MTLGRRLRELREAAGLSQAQLAKLTGISRNAVSQWEADATQPSTKRLILLAQSLKVPLDRLMAPSTEVRERLVNDAMRLFERLGFEETSKSMICATADISEAEFDQLFASKEDLLYEVATALKERTFADVRRIPPKYGSLAARLKYLLHMYYVHDVAHLKLTAALQAYSWRWSDARERDHTRHLSEYHATVLSLFDEAQAQGQIKQGNYRAASSLILAAYIGALRKAVYEPYDADKLVASLEPQIALLLDGLNYRVVLGFADGEEKA